MMTTVGHEGVEEADAIFGSQDVPILLEDQGKEISL